MKRNLLALTGLLLAACTPVPAVEEPVESGSSTSVTSIMEDTLIPATDAAMETIPQTNEEWKKVLSPEQYAILREEGTEKPFTSPLLDEHRPGTYVTADCGDPVFRSEQKFDSGTGWPSFWAPISKDAVIEKVDTRYGMKRVEIRSRCGGHLGHVFSDGPEPTGLRYCMNGVALKFIPDEDAAQPSL